MDNEYPFFSDESFAFQDVVGFSSDICKEVYDGMTVTYSMIQIAAYMGFSEIYLIGVDHNYATNENDGMEGKNENYMAEMKMEKRSWANPANLDKSTLGYIRARDYCDIHCIKIRNCTRGGKLEVFERCSLEGVLGR